MSSSPVSSAHSVYTDEKTLENGQTLHFSFETIHPENRHFWYCYGLQSENVGMWCDDFCCYVNDLTYPNGWSESFEYTQEEYVKVTELIRRKEYFRHHPCAQTARGISGMLAVLRPDTAVWRQDKIIAMAYASTSPVARCHDVGREVESIANYKKLFGNIVMSVPVITKEGSPSVSHYGIFRNPLSFFDVEEKYRGLSLKLHGFAATVALTQFVGKKYMITTPTQVMSQIFCKSIGNESMYIGTNRDIKSGGISENSHKYSPIYHIDQTTGVQKIAKKGVDLSNYLTSLPDEHAECIATPGETFYFGRETLGAQTTVIDLEKLAKFY